MAIPSCEADEINARLGSLYEARWEAITTILREGEEHSNPLLISIADEYAQASCRILIVGQETHHWWGSFVASPARERIPELQRQYAAFDFAAHYRPTPFWRGVHELRQRLVPESNHRAMAWGNLNLADWRGKRACGEEQALAELGLLRAEIAILRPEIVVFLTGPHYDGVLSVQFPGRELIPIGETPIRALARVVHTDLPAETFRTYHPNYLQRARRWNLIGEIVLATDQHGRG